MTENVFEVKMFYVVLFFLWMINGIIVLVNWQNPITLINAFACGWISFDLFNKFWDK